MAAFVCAACKEVVRDLYNQFEERIEYRRRHDQGRHAVILKRHLCRTCMEAAVEAERPSPTWDQPTLA